MTANNTITNIKRQLIRAFATLDGWFDREDEFHDYKSIDGQQVREVFAGILEISHSLMLVIDNAGNHARRLVVDNDLDNKISDYSLDEKIFEEERVNRFLKEISVHRKNEMFHRSLPEIRSELRDQLDRCLCHIELLRNGEGVPYNMKLNHIDMDVYHCMHLLSLQLWKYIQVLTSLELEFNTRG